MYVCPQAFPSSPVKKESARGCGVTTLSINYYDIGYKAGEMAVDILVNGADITMAIESAPQCNQREYNGSNLQRTEYYSA